MNELLTLDAIYDSRKSFYEKAMVLFHDDKVTLYSYNTAIVEVDDDNITVLWDGWSMTTGRHINEFFKQFYDTPCNKKLFMKIQNGEVKTIEELQNESKEKY